MAIIWVLAGVDGTGSRDWGRPGLENSHIRRFCRDFSTEGSNNRYFHGPNTEASDYDSILQDVKAWVCGQIDYYKRERPTDELRICLVGHSRGGGTVIDLAKYLGRRTNGAGPVQVYFMGLYDPVIMNRTDTDSVENVRYVARAFRAMVDGSIQRQAQFAARLHEVAQDSGSGQTGNAAYNLQGLAGYRSNNTRSSRSLFRITGTQKGAGVVDFDEPMHRYNTSHGGMGGDPGLFNNGFGHDMYCNCTDNLAVVSGMRDNFGGRNTQGIIDFLSQPIFQSYIDKIRTCITQSRAADAHIRYKAKQVFGLPFRSEASPHIPYQSAPPHLVEALRHLHVPL